MTIKEFIRDFKEKRIFADGSLPKYTDLAAKVKEEGEKDHNLVLNINNNQWLSTDTNQSATRVMNPTFPIKVSDHMKQILDQGYEHVMEFLKNDPDLKVFNDEISEYLRAESGISLSFMGTRPGGGSRPSISGGSWSLERLLEDPDKVSGENWKGLSSLGILDRLKLVFSKKKGDKLINDIIYENQARMMGADTEDIEKIRATKTLTIDDFFEQVKIKVSGKDEVLSRIKPIYKNISQAKAMGQIALIETLLEKLVVEVYECAIAGSGFDRAISLTDLNNLQDKCKKLLSMNQISNFTRAIPTNVIERKLEADKLHVFDNYVVLSYDPSGEDYKETTQQAINRAKDPILFGVILGSEKLYYIADWVDEFCDLTWDKMLTIMGKQNSDFKL